MAGLECSVRVRPSRPMAVGILSRLAETEDVP